MIHRAFAAAHTHFGTFFGNRFVWKNPNPYFAASLNKMGHGPPGGFNLARTKPAGLQRFKTIGSKTKFIAAASQTPGTAFMPFSMFYSFGQQHNYKSLLL